MADTIPGNTSTTATITVGGTVNGTLETGPDHDWFRIELTAGQSIEVALNGTGGTPPDTYLRMRNSAGTEVAFDDDGGPGYNSALAFIAPTAGTYYIDVGSFNDEEFGTYQLQVSGYVEPPTYTYDQIADQLINGYWESQQPEPLSARRFAVAPGGTLEVNLTELTAEGQFLAEQALNLWSDITGITFNQVATGADITFDDLSGPVEGGAYNISDTTGDFITHSFVNVDVKWIDPELGGYGFGLNTYSFQTYLHEIGHALGLGHAGNYNDDADYLTNAHYANDGWATTVMSYFDQDQNFYFQRRGFTSFFTVTPMAADILAMSQMYGLSTTTRTGDTIYGFNSTAGRDVFNATLHQDVAYTLFDSGGRDTLDYSLFANNQLIDLRPEMFSNVGNGIGNVSIGRGVIIENATTGGGHDLLIGNSANNVLTGGTGNDTASYVGAAAGVTVSLAVTTNQNTGGAGTDRLSGIENLVGSGFNDVLTGNGSANTIEGGAGNDTLNGGLGSDTLSFASATGFVIVNLATTAAQNTRAGTDTISGFERMIGSAFNDQLSGDSVDNILYGRAGNDVLRGASGNDTMHGEDGDDRLEGGGGNDTLNGNTGRDSAVYSSAASAVTVNLALAGAQNTVGAGSDTLSSIERIIGSNFNDTLTGNTSNNVLYGEGGIDSISASSGSDVIYGGTGNDSLTGGLGRDTFVFNTALNGATNVDTLTDYAAAYDKVQLSTATFTALSGTGTLSANAFFAGTNAHDADDRIIYDSVTGKIYYDADGTGAGAKIQFAQVNAGVAMTNSDFNLIG